MSVFAIILLFFAVGLVLQRHFTLPASLPALLNNSVINVAYPAAVLLGVAGADWTMDALFPVGSYWVGVATLWFVCLGLKRLLGWDGKTQACVFLLTACGNTAYLGYPMVSAFFAPDALQYALLYDQLGSFVAVSILGPTVVAILASNDKRPSLLGLAFKILTFPPFAIVIISTIVPLGGLVDILRPLLKLLATLIVPMTMIAIGLQFKLTIAKQHKTPLICALGIKMLVLPIVVALAAWAFAIPKLIATVTIFEAAMPPMVTAAALLLAAKVDDALVTSILGIGTILAFISLPLLSQLLLI